jgi:hypothetical protein
LLTGVHPFDLFDSREGTWVWRNSCKNPVSAHLGRILDKMLETPINRRYQSATEVLQDLNSQKPPVVVKQQTPVQSKPTVTSYGGKIDTDLAEIKSQFLGSSTPKSSSQKQAYPPIPPTVKNKVEQELEEIKSQFLGSPNPKNPQS